MCSIYFVRHGLTNDDLPTNDRVTGWLDIDINAEGRANARRAAHILKSKGITSITSSDSKRCCHTAEIIGRELSLPVIESDKLRSWNMGALQGMLHTTANPFMEFFEKNPDVTVPKGEPFRRFYNRFRAAFNGFVAYVRKFPNAVPLVCTHSQDLDMITWFIKGVEPGRELEFGNGIKPGGILEVNIEGDKITMRKLRL
jgi:broad specificity phosphatase PhoE